MNYTITTYDKNGNEIVTRHYESKDNDENLSTMENYSYQLWSILEDSHTYLEEQAVDYKEEPLTEE